MSFEYFTRNGDHYFLFMDNVNNKNLNKYEKPKTHGSGIGGWLTTYIVDPASGDVSMLYFLDSRKVKGMPLYQFSTDRIVKTSDNDFVFEVYKKNKQDILIKVDMD